jgi:hypothetical protein
MFLANPRDQIASRGVQMAPTNVRPRPPVVPPPPSNLLQFIALWSTKSDAEFRFQLRTVWRNHVGVRTFFKRRNVDFEQFLLYSKAFAANFLFTSYAELNHFVPRSLRTSTTARTFGDSLLLQYGNAVATFNGNKLCPGSRLVLGKLANPKLLTKTSANFNTVEFPPEATSGYGGDLTSDSPFAKYHAIDLTKPAEIGFWANLKYGAPGVVTSVSMVPMGKHIKDTAQPTLQDYKYYGDFVDDYDGGTEGKYSASQAIDYMTSSFKTREEKLQHLAKFADEMGLGYNDSHGQGQCSSVEVNIVEMTAVGLSVTLHGVVGHDSNGKSVYDLEGLQCGVHGKKNNDGVGGVCRLTKKMYNQSNQVVTVGEVTSSPQFSLYGPSELANSFWINTKKPFFVHAKTESDAINGTLALTVTLTQERNILEVYILSDKKAFPVAGEYLDSMNLVVSQWSGSYHGIYEGFYEGSTWWLDGFQKESLDDTGDYRGWTVESDEQLLINTFEVTYQILDGAYGLQLDNLGVADPFRNYSYAYTMAKAVVEDAAPNIDMKSPVLTGIFDLTVWNKDASSQINPVSQSDFLPVWIQEAYSRGFISDETKDASEVLEWNGQYQSKYGVLYDSHENDHTVTPTLPNFIRTLDSTAAKPAEDFMFYQVTTNDLSKYSLSSQFQRFQGSIYNPMKGIGIKEVYAKTQQIVKNEYCSIKHPYKMAELGINYIDAEGVLIDGQFFVYK